MDDCGAGMTELSDESGERLAAALDALVGAWAHTAPSRSRSAMRSAAGSSRSRCRCAAVPRRAGRPEPAAGGAGGRGLAGHGGDTAALAMTAGLRDTYTVPRWRPGAVSGLFTILPVRAGGRRARPGDGVGRAALAARHRRGPRRGRRAARRGDPAVGAACERG